MGNAIDLAGRRFGRLVAIRRSDPAPGGKSRWLCACDCGRETIKRHACLVRGTSESCGCLARELTSKRSSSHGMTKTREYETWHRMKERCYTATTNSYPHYGGRGIRVCDRWLNSFENFYFDMGDRPPGSSIDRIDSNKDYSPDNCKWSTLTEQNRNKRSNVSVTAHGKTMLAADWAREIGVSQTTIYDRAKKGLTGESLVSPKGTYGRWTKQGTIARQSNSRS